MNRYRVYLVPSANTEIKRLPGHVRQRVKRAVDGLADDPRPSSSTQLDVSDIPDCPFELRRLRIEQWRVVFAVSEADAAVDILGVRKRPPYDHGDLEDLLKEL